MPESEAGTRIRQLHEVRDALERLELTAKIMQPRQSPPYVRVVNPVNDHLSEQVDIRPYKPLDQAEEPWFVTSWGHPLAPATDAEKGASEVARIVAVNAEH